MIKTTRKILIELSMAAHFLLVPLVLHLILFAVNKAVHLQGNIGDIIDHIIFLTSGPLLILFINLFISNHINKKRVIIFAVVCFVAGIALEAAVYFSVYLCTKPVMWIFAFIMNLLCRNVCTAKAEVCNQGGI